MEILNDLFTPEQWTEYVDRMTHGERIGQAFFNSAPLEWQERLRGSLFDPFYKDSERAIVDAIDFLTR